MDCGPVPPEKCRVSASFVPVRPFEIVLHRSSNNDSVWPEGPTAPLCKPEGRTLKSAVGLYSCMIVSMKLIFRVSWIGWSWRHTGTFIIVIHLLLPMPRTRSWQSDTRNAVALLTICGIPLMCEYTASVFSADFALRALYLLKAKRQLLYIFLHFLDSASPNNSGRTNLTHNFLWFVYLNPLHVLSNSVLILRRTTVLTF
jgi:hypothetical protein